MKTEHLLAEKLKEMMTTMPLDEISVSLLSDKCGVNRKTFYYHFHDIYDLLMQVFLDEKIAGADKANTPSDLLVAIHNYYSKNSKFIDATLSSAGKDLFEEFIYNAVYQAFVRMISKIENAKQISPSERKNIVRFYTSGYAHAITFYFDNFKNKTIHGLAHSVKFLGENFLEDAVNKSLLEREESLK